MLRILRIGEIPSKNFQGKGLACYELSKHKNIKTTLYTPYPELNDKHLKLSHKNLTIHKYFLLKNRHARKSNTGFLTYLNKFLENLFAYSFANIQLILRNLFKNFDVIHIHHPAFSPIFILGKMKGMVCSYTSHGYDSYKVMNSIFLKLFLNNVDIIFCMSMSQIKQFKILYPNKKIIFASNGVDFNLFNFPKEYKFRKKQIICIGSLTWKKDYITILKAFQEVNAEINDWKLLIIGEGPEKKKIKNLIEKSNLKDKVSLMGTISREEVSEELTSSKIYLINSIQEGLPKSLIEAMASGCACISSDAGECERVIDSCGILIKKQNILSTKNAIIQLIRDQRLSSELSKKAKEKSKQYSWEKYISNQINAYKEFIKE